MSEYPKTKLQAQLATLGACSPAREWVGDRSLTRAWAECDRADWLLWLAARAGVDRRLVVLAACDCARTALRHVPAGDGRPRRAIETAEALARGEATLDDVLAAADAAYNAASTAAYAAYTAAYTAAYANAATAANAAANAANYAATASTAAAAAAAYAAASARRRAHLRMCRLVRERIQLRSVQAAMRGVR